MKVLIVDQFGKTTGRDTLALAELVNLNSDVEVEVYLSDNTEIPQDKRYSVSIHKGFHGAYTGNILHKCINYLKSLFELNRFIAKNHFDIIHLQWFSLPWLEWVFVKHLVRKHKVVITVHDVIPFDKRPLEKESLDKIYSYANELLIHTETSKKLFNNVYKNKTPIKVISQGFCIKSDYKRKDNNESKKHFNIPSDSVVFLYYGTIRPSKGFDLLIKAIKSAHNEDTSVYFLAAGAFHNVDEKQIRKMAEECLSSDYSTINFGFVPYEEEQWYFSAADVLCLPYLELTQSGVAQLGLMYDLPLIATCVGEMNEVCRDGENGIIVKPGDEKQLAEAILKMAKDDSFRNKASKRSSSLGESDFSLNKKAEKVYQSYKSLVSKQ